MLGLVWVDQSKGNAVVLCLSPTKLCQLYVSQEERLVTLEFRPSLQKCNIYLLLPLTQFFIFLYKRPPKLVIIDATHKLSHLQTSEYLPLIGNRNLLQ